MRATSRKNQALLKQYPFVSAIIAEPMEPFDGSDGTEIDDLTIRVEKADGDLMFRRARNTGLGDSSFILQFGGKRKDQVMRRGEYLYAIDGGGHIVNRLDWPRNDEEQKVTGEIYGWSVLWGTKHGPEHYSDPLCDKAEYLVWVTVETWHEDTKNDDAAGSRFGEFRDRVVHVTIYGKPDGGFDELQQNSSVYTNLRLDSRIMMRGTLDKVHDIVAIGGMLYEMCITFQDEVYFNGMKDVLDNGEFRGASGQFGSVKVLCAEMCGYDRVMLEDSVSYVTFQLRPGSKHMYVLGQDGTLPQIRNLVKIVVRMWNQRPELRAAFTPDKNVSVM